MTTIKDRFLRIDLQPELAIHMIYTVLIFY